MVKTGKTYIIIVAAGTGNRFGGNLPKQFAPLCGSTVLMHTINAFNAIDIDTEIILVLSESELDRWAELCNTYKFKSPIIVRGGKTRTESVRNALDAISDISEQDIILIHDGARPLVDSRTIYSVIDKLRENGVGAVIPYTPITDSLMTAHFNDAEPIDRNRFVAVQTPQGFNAMLLKKSYANLRENDTMSDDASVVSKYGGVKINLVEGSRKNIKITYSSDIKIAELLIQEDN